MVVAVPVEVVNGVPAEMEEEGVVEKDLDIVVVDEEDVDIVELPVGLSLTVEDPEEVAVLDGVSVGIIYPSVWVAEAVAVPDAVAEEESVGGK